MKEYFPSLEKKKSIHLFLVFNFFPKNGEITKNHSLENKSEGLIARIRASGLEFIS